MQEHIEKDCSRDMDLSTEVVKNNLIPTKQNDFIF